jgi:hypothetical protein
VANVPSDFSGGRNSDLLWLLHGWGCGQALD